MAVQLPADAYLAALIIILRVTIGLFVHGLRRPGMPARICRGGWVLPR